MQDLVDPVTGDRFFRPFGGEIEFGERAVDALRREFREELDVELTEPRLLGVIENLFTYGEQPGHEVVFVFDAQFNEQSLPHHDDLVRREPRGEPVPGVWLKLSELSTLAVPLYPVGLSELVKASVGPAGASRTIRGHTDWSRFRGPPPPDAP